MPILIAIFLLSLFVFILQNPSSVLPRTTLYFDAAHYLETAKRMYETIRAAFAHGITPQALDALAFYLMLDGPVLPGAGVLLFALLNQAPNEGGWQAIVIMQCVFHAASCVLVYLLSLRLCQSKLWSLLGSTLWMLYPAAIASCNSYLTEPLACLLSLSSIFFVSELARKEPGGLSYLRCLLAGMSLALFLLLKPAFAPAIGIISIVATVAAFVKARGLDTSINDAADSAEDSRLSFSFARAGFARVLLAVLGGLLVVLPWLSFTYAARGTLNLMPSRRPVYNICTGLNIEGDGWGCYPTHPVALMYDDNEAPLPVLLALIEQNSAEIANLSLRKITRLWNLPWNDYRYKILGLNYRTQAIFHLLLVLLGLSGLLLFIAELFRKNSKWTLQEKVVAVSIPLYVLGHLIYLPFEGISRYGFTALPCLIVAAVCFLKNLFELNSKAAASEKVASRVIQVSYFLTLLLLLFVSKFDLTPYAQAIFKNAFVSISALAVLKASLFSVGLLLLLKMFRILYAQAPSVVFKAALLVCITLSYAISFAFAVSNREALTWKSTLKNADAISRIVSVDVDKNKPSWALLMIDGDQHLPEAKLLVNGQELESPVSLYQFDSSKYELEDWLNQFASLIREAPTFIRRWRAVPVPVDLIKTGSNDLSVLAPPAGAVTVYGDYLHRLSGGRRVLPSANEVSPGKFFNDSEDAFDSRIMQACYSVPVSSICKFTHNGKVNEKDLSLAAGLQNGEYRIFLLLGYAHPSLSNLAETDEPAPLVKHVDSVALGSGEAARAQFSVEVDPAVLRGSHLGVTVSGNASSLGSSDFAVAGVLDKGERLIASILPGTPQMFKTGADGRTFKLKSEIPLQTVKGKTMLRIELQKAAGSDCVIHDLDIRVEGVNKPQFAGHSIKVF